MRGEVKPFPHAEAARSGYHRVMAGASDTNGGARAGLYERLVGDGWKVLDEPVRRLHLRARAAGVFAVRRGEGRVARVVARLMGLPRGGEAVPLLLSVEPHDGGERWRRTFDGREFVTHQSEHAGALLCERTGPFELLFRLHVEGGALAYRQEGAALCAGGLKVSLPRLLAPRVEARERAAEGGVSVSVCVTAPLVGLLIRYEGLVRTEEETG
jgi:hypothetical protein